jgi:hypothetical protein
MDITNGLPTEIHAVAGKLADLVQRFPDPSGRLAADGRYLAERIEDLAVDVEEAVLSMPADCTQCDHTVTEARLLTDGVCGRCAQANALFTQLADLYDNDEEELARQLGHYAEECGFRPGRTSAQS